MFLTTSLSRNEERKLIILYAFYYFNILSPSEAGKLEHRKNLKKTKLCHGRSPRVALTCKRAVKFICIALEFTFVSPVVVPYSYT